MTLYEINEKILAFLDANVDPETGEVLNLDALGDLELERSIKLEHYALVCKNYDAEIAALKAEEDKLRERRRRCENAREKLAEVLKTELGGEKIKTPRVTVSYRRSQSVNAPDVWKLPEDYRRYKDPEPDKIKLKAALAAGEKIDGAELVENVSMIIK